MHFLSGLLAMREIESQAHVHLTVRIHSCTRFGLSFIQTFSLSVQSVSPSVRPSVSQPVRQAGVHTVIPRFLFPLPFYQPNTLLKNTNLQNVAPTIPVGLAFPTSTKPVIKRLGA